MLKLADNIGQALQHFKSTIAQSKGTLRNLLQSDIDGMVSSYRPGPVSSGVMNRESVTPHKILWVDDIPGNNDWERKALETYGVQFTLARDTNEAEQKIFGDEAIFDAIISDLARPSDRNAGYILLSRLRKAGIFTPYFLYTGANAAKAVDLAISSGAQGITADPDTLVAMVIAALN